MNMVRTERRSAGRSPPSASGGSHGTRVAPLWAGTRSCSFFASGCTRGPSTLARMPATPTTSPIAFTDEELAGVRYNADGLVAAIVQEAGTGAVLMMAWMNADSLRRTLETGRTWFWSRSRQEFWCKGETSGDRQFVREAYYDCDGDALLFVVEQEGRGACHTGERSCFFRAFGDPSATPGPV
jgi:phosphoribosyl-AMP cyclohydrolase